MRWRGGPVPQLPRRGVPGPDRSTPRLPSFPLCERARSSPPAVTPGLRPSLPSLAVGVFPSDFRHLPSLLLASFPRWTKGSGLAGELPVACIPRPRPTGRMPAGRTTSTAPPRAYRPGLCSQSDLPRSIPSPRTIQTHPAFSSQRHPGLASSSRHLFLFFYLLLF